MNVDIPLLFILGSTLLVLVELFRSEGKNITAWAVGLLDVALLYARLK